MEVPRQTQVEVPGTALSPPTVVWTEVGCGMSRARLNIERAVRDLGYEIVELGWEPIGRGAEKEGPSGGWWGRVTPDPSPPGSSGMDWIAGYSWQEVVENARAFLPVSRGKA